MPRTTASAGSKVPAWAERLVLFLDDGFVLPGTSFRVGFDAVLGLIPGIGDLITTSTSLSLLYLAHERGVPKPVIARMVLNVAVDAAVGAIPVLGDVFDVVFKANRRNLTLLQRYDVAPRQATVRDSIFLITAAMVMLAVLMIPMVLAVLLVRALLA
ncbi:MAG TPA: DUF4112 domain-containing protein [Candidatus Limnocylindrales bacterium]|nr:DUF4112 domain-containing protein [Candidatus Limnocylindrales bacterium]